MIGSIFEFTAGIAVFLFGMNVMGESLRALGGGRPQSLIGKLCHTPTLGILTGALATVLVQSSSAVTVMVVGFVNSGIMTLGQSVGVIMGANLGTTVTSWLIAVTRVGESGASAFGSLLTALPAAIGIIFIMTSRCDSRRGLGYALLGFTVLMLGMRMMSDATAPLAESDAVRGMISVLSSPILGILSGALLTAVVQSSSAAVGILQAVAAGGALTCGVALPIILGQNIGTCITTLLSGIGAGKNARRAAFVHFYFNVIGAAAAWVLIFLGKLMGVGEGYFSRSTDAFSIAVMHTAFNAFAAALLLPFSRLLEHLAILTVPDNAGAGKKENKVSEVSISYDGKKIEKNKTFNENGEVDEIKAGKTFGQTNSAVKSVETGGFGGYSILDERFLAAPAFAYSMACAAFLRMCDLAAKSFACCAKQFAAVTDDSENSGDNDAEDVVGDGTELVAIYARSIRAYLTALPLAGLRGRIYRLYAAVGDVASIDEYSARLSALTKRMRLDGVRCGNATREALRIAADTVLELVSLLSSLSSNCDNEIGYREAAQNISDSATHLIDAAQRRLVDDICEGADARAGVYVDSALVCLDRIAAHAVEIFTAASDIGIAENPRH